MASLFLLGGSKEVTHDIDSVLATFNGLTDAGLDFIVNYDIKYRVGSDGGEDEE